MGLVITSQINTDKGATSSAYLNIRSVTYVKEMEQLSPEQIASLDSIGVKLNIYLNIDERNQSPKDNLVRTSEVPNRLGINTMNPDMTDALKANENIFAVAYVKIKEKLIELGLQVEDAI